MTEKLPDDNDANSEAKPTALTEVYFTEAELKVLLDADPGDDGLEEAMAAHGMEFNQDVVIHVEGQPDAVYTTSEDDFMTRNTAASQEWNTSVSVAQGILNLETEIDQHSFTIEAEAIEQGAKEITVEEAQKIGEPTVEIAGVEDPSMTLAKRLFETSSINIRIEAATSLRAVIGGLSENSNNFQTSERVFLDGIASSTNRLEAVLKAYEDYPLNSIQTEISAALEALQGPMRAGLSIGEQGLNEIERYTVFAEKTFADQAQFASDADENFKAALAGETIENFIPAKTVIEDAKKVVTEIPELNTVLRNVDSVTRDTLDMLKINYNHLQEILGQSHNRPIDVHELIGTVVELKKLSSNDNAHNVFKLAHTSVNKLIEQVKLAVEQLDPTSA